MKQNQGIISSDTCRPKSPSKRTSPTHAIHEPASSVMNAVEYCLLHGLKLAGPEHPAILCAQESLSWGVQDRSSLICATIVCTVCEHAQPKLAKNSSHTTSALAHEDLPRRRIARWLSAYFLVPNSRSRRQSSIKP